MLTLILLNKHGKPTRFILNGRKPELIGRHAPRLKVEDKQVSRRHAEILLENGVWILRDLGSKNGTFINGEQVKGIAELEAGDEIKIGRFSFVIGHVEVDMGAEVEKSGWQEPTEDTSAGTMGPGDSDQGFIPKKYVADDGDNDDDDEDEVELEVDSFASQVKNSLTRSDPQFEWADDDDEDDDDEVIPIAVPNFPRANPDAPEKSNLPLSFDEEEDGLGISDSSAEAAASEAEEPALEEKADEPQPPQPRPDSPLDTMPQPQSESPSQRGGIAERQAAAVDEDDASGVEIESAEDDSPEDVGVSSGFDAIAESLSESDDDAEAGSDSGIGSLDDEIAASLANDDFDGLGDIAPAEGSSVQMDLAVGDELQAVVDPDTDDDAAAEPDLAQDQEAQSVVDVEQVDEADDEDEDEPVGLVGLSLDKPAPEEPPAAVSPENADEGGSEVAADLLDIEDFESWLESDESGSIAAIQVDDASDSAGGDDSEQEAALEIDSDEEEPESGGAVGSDEESSPATPSQQTPTLREDDVLEAELAEDEPPEVEPAKGDSPDAPAAGGEAKSAFESDLSLPTDANSEEAKRLLAESEALDNQRKKQSRKFWSFAAILLVAGGVAAMYFAPWADSWHITGRSGADDTPVMADPDAAVADATDQTDGVIDDAGDTDGATASDSNPGSTASSGDTASLLADAFIDGPTLLNPPSPPDAASSDASGATETAAPPTTSPAPDDPALSGSTSSVVADGGADETGTGEDVTGDVAMDGPPTPGAAADASPTKPEAIPSDGRRVVFLIDASGSMVDSMNDGVLTWLDREIESLGSADRFTVLFFRSDQVLEVPPEGMKVADRETRNAVKDWIKPSQGNVLPHEKSDPVPSLRTAVSYKPREIVILSDNLFGRRGSTTADVDAFELSTLVSPEAVTINTVQFFYRDPQGRLEAIAERFGGSFEFVPERVYEDELGELLGEARTGL